MIDRDAQLRRLASAAPDEGVWAKIVAALDGIEALTDGTFAELRDRLATWPFSVRRVLPLRWVFEEPILVGRRSPLRKKPWPPGVALATHLDLSAPSQPALTSSGGELLRLFQARELEGLRSIVVGVNGGSAKQWGQIAATPRRSSLQHLAIQGADAHIANLFAGPCFGALEHLDLRDGRLGAAEIPSLLHAPALAQLTRLDLARNPIGDAGLRLLATSRCLTGDLERTGVTDASMPSLAQAERLSTFAALTLADNRISAAGVASLMASTGIENLHTLDLNRCEIGADGARAIAAAPHLFLLRSLRLRGAKIGAGGLRALLTAPWIADLEELDLSDCDLNDAALKPLLQLRAARLRKLALDGAAITAHTLGQLLASPAGSELESLSLDSCAALGPQGAAAVAHAPTSARLRVLNIRNCNIGPDGAQALESSRYLTGLRESWI